LIAQDMTVEHAAVLGDWLHGQAGDEAWVAIGGKGVLTTSEVSTPARSVLAHQNFFPPKQPYLPYTPAGTKSR